MSNVNYSFTDQDSNGNIVFRSTVNSFGLDHVTDKDLTSFYTKFSSNAYLDTGLLPVDGSGLLAIRSAGNHTQIAYQHKPGMYYINWGRYERDAEAKKYYVAQPYRIVIADLLNDNILGARTFYSPIPITYPQAPLYHINVPNINCKGYRGNAVGWICLYHTEDISQYPFNEKLAKILDRCSGTEAYNDNNMSETDGPRFYRDNNKPEHLTNPQDWEDYSDKNGYEWTLDPEVWIPILVQDIDHQDQHYAGGQALTFVDALFGNYQAYYTDSLIPKPINAISRDDLTLDPTSVFRWFKQSYNASSETNTTIDTFNSSTTVREALSQAAPVFVANQDEDEEEEDEDDDEETHMCQQCESWYSPGNVIEVYNGELICTTCVSNSYTYVSHIKNYVDDDHEELYYDETLARHYYLPDWPYHISCPTCDHLHIYDPGMAFNKENLNIWHSNSSFAPDRCTECIDQYIYVSEGIAYNSCKCSNCDTNVPNLATSIFSVYYRTDGEGLQRPLCTTCALRMKLMDVPLNIDLTNKIEWNHSEQTVEESIHLCICGVENDTFLNLDSLKISHPSFLFTAKSTTADIINAHPTLVVNPTGIDWDDNNEVFVYDVSVDKLCSTCWSQYSQDAGYYYDQIKPNVVDLFQKLHDNNQSFETISGLHIQKAEIF